MHGDIIKGTFVPRQHPQSRPESHKGRCSRHPTTEPGEPRTTLPTTTHRNHSILVVLVSDNAHLSTVGLGTPLVQADGLILI